jgi:hypothetical protein
MIYLVFVVTVGALGIGWVAGMWTRKWTLGGCQHCGCNLVCVNCLRLTTSPHPKG